MRSEGQGAACLPTSCHLQCCGLISEAAGFEVLRPVRREAGASVCVVAGKGGGRGGVGRVSRGLLHQPGQLEPDRSMLTYVHSLNLSLCSFELSGGWGR